MSKQNENGKKSFLDKLSKRDKQLLTFVGGAAVLAAGGMLTVNSFNSMSQLAEEHATITSELDGKNAKVSQKKALIKQLTSLNAETLEQAKKYYGTTNQGEFIFLIDKLVNDSGIKFRSVNYSESTELDLQQEASATSSSSPSTTSNSATSSSSDTSSSSSSDSSSSSATSSSSSDTASSSSDASSSSSAGSTTTTAASTATPGTNPYTNTNISQMTADIEFEGTYTQVLKLLELIDNNQQKIVSSELELGDSKSLSNVEEQNNPEISGKIKLRFYQVKDVERYVTNVESNIDKTPIPFAGLESPFAIPGWLAASKSVTTVGGGTDTAGNSNITLGAATTNTDSSLAPAYLEQLSNQSSQNGGLSAYYNSSAIYRFESPLKLVQAGGGYSADVPVDNTDFLEGSGSNVVKIPATKSPTLYEMEFPSPYVTLNSKPDALSFSLSLSSTWQGKVGVIVRNASGQKIYLHVIRPNNWTGWREVSFDPASIPGFSYPMTILGYFFETPNGDSPETTMKLDNLAVNNLVVN